MLGQAYPIFVTGCPRSGASMVANILQECGAWTGKITLPKNHNPRGLMEHEGLFDRMVKPYLVKKDACPAGQFPLVAMKDVLIPVDWQSRVETILSKEGYEWKTPWMYKSNKLTLLWPIWDYAFRNARWLIVRRRTADIVESCLQTGYMRAFKSQANQEAVGAKTEEEAWLWWVHQYEQRFVAMLEAGVNVKILWPERMVQGDYQQLYEAIEWLGLKWNSSVVSLIDPKFWKVRRDRNVGSV